MLETLNQNSVTTLKSTIIYHTYEKSDIAGTSLQLKQCPTQEASTEDG